MWAENKVRIVDIANELGVSTATVSNVLHGKTKKISAQTAARVQAKLEERGYIPNMAATLLAQNSSRIIGVVINDHEKYEGRVLTDPFVASSVNDLAEEIERSGHFMMIKRTQELMEAVPFASMWNMTGMVLLGFCDREYRELRGRIRIPFVVFDGCFEDGGRFCGLQLDHRDGGRQVGEHLRQLGHKKVLCIADNCECMDRQRYEGLCEGLGFPADFLEIPMRREDRERFYRTHLDRIRGYSAVFAVSDYYAADLMRFLQSVGVRIPEEISVAGFDGGAICEQISPSLTSVRQDYRLRARTAVEMLRRMRECPDYAEDLLIPVELVVRESTGRLRH